MAPLDDLFLQPVCRTRKIALRFGPVISSFCDPVPSIPHSDGKAGCSLRGDAGTRIPAPE